MAFYRALRIYPNPVDLLGIYQKAIIEPVFKVRPVLPFFFHSSVLNVIYLQLIVEMTNLDVSPPSSPLIPSMGLDEDTSPTRGPSSEASSQEWDRVTDPGSQTQTPE